MVPNTQRALATALIADIAFVGGLVLAWAREFYLGIPRWLADSLIVLGLALALVAGVRLFGISRGATDVWRRSRWALGLTLVLAGLPAAVFLAWAIYYRVV
jgi:hypothetical protein